MLCSESCIRHLSLLYCGQRLCKPLNRAVVLLTQPQGKAKKVKFLYVSALVEPFFF